MHHPDGRMSPVTTLQADGGTKDVQLSHDALPFGVS
jgi:hypothetical protein